MTWNIDKSKPIYLQLMDYIQYEIITGRYHPGDQIPSVRELASSAAVNPNTMQKALSELERLGFLYSKRTSGRFVTKDQVLIDTAQKALAKKHLDEFLHTMHLLHVSKDEIMTLITTDFYLEEESK